MLLAAASSHDNSSNHRSGGGDSVSLTDSTAVEMHDMGRGSGRPREARATDIVVEGAGDEGSQPRQREGGSGADESQPLTAVAPGEPRTMGEVYPIMKNTIYEDEECSEEVRLGAMDCGARFIRYVNGLFQYLVRNPKTMGFLLTTAVILLFFKYAQQVVVRSVNSALNTHPGLEPSDELRSGVIAFTTEMRAFESVARTLQWAYVHDNIVGYDLATITGSTFLALAASLQKSFAANKQTSVLYKIPASRTATGKAQWGQAGCLDAASHLGTGPLCFHIAADGTAVGFRGTNTSDILFRIPNEYADSRMTALTELEAVTAGSAAARDGIWSQPLKVTEPFYESSYRIIGYMLPIAFDEHATAFANVDVSVQHMAAALNVGIRNVEVVVADSRYMREQGGQFVLDTFEPALFWPEPHSVTETPSARVNEITRPIHRKHRHNMMVNASFYADGLIYESLTMMNRWVLLAASPMVLSAAEVEAAFRSLLDEYERVTTSASQAFTECQQSAEEQADNVFLEAVGRFEETFGSRIHSLYVAYQLEDEPAPPPASSSSSDSHGSSDKQSGTSSNANSRDSSDKQSQSHSGGSNHGSSDKQSGASSNTNSRDSSDKQSQSHSGGSNHGSSDKQSGASSNTNSRDSSDKQSQSRSGSSNHGSSDKQSGASSNTNSRDSSDKQSQSRSGSSNHGSSDKQSGASSDTNSRDSSDKQSQSRSGSSNHGSSDKQSGASSNANSRDSSSNKATSAGSDGTSTVEPQQARTWAAAVRETSEAGTPEERWGSCGCSYGSGDDTAYTCFYTNGDGLETLFDGAVRSAATHVRHLTFSTTRRFAFVKEQIRGATTREGFWTRPYNSYDTLTDETNNAMSYVLPFRFDAHGNVAAAAVFDLTMDWIPDFIREYTHEGTTGVLLIDRRDQGTFMGSRTSRIDKIYPAMATPNETINAIWRSVYERAGSTFDRDISFHEGPRLINYQLIEPYWGIVEQIPADVALARFLPTPTVRGATDALRLIPTGETIELFLYVVGILLCYFLNLLILGCSKLGKEPKPKPAGQAGPSAASTASEGGRSSADSSAATTPRASAWV